VGCKSLINQKLYIYTQKCQIPKWPGVHLPHSASLQVDTCCGSCEPHCTKWLHNHQVRNSTCATEHQWYDVTIITTYHSSGIQNTSADVHNRFPRMIRTLPRSGNIMYTQYTQTQTMTPHVTYLSASRQQISIRQIYKITNTHNLQLLHMTTK